MDTLVERANDVRLLVLDVDGVLTDGRLYFSSRGEELKCFHVRDGAGIVQVLRAGLQVAVISGRQSRAVERRMSELGVTWIRQGVQDKLAALRELLDILALGPQAVASMGDDTARLADLRDRAAGDCGRGCASQRQVARALHYAGTRRHGRGARSLRPDPRSPAAQPAVRAR